MGCIMGIWWQFHINTPFYIVMIPLGIIFYCYVNATVSKKKIWKQVSLLFCFFCIGSFMVHRQLKRFESLATEICNNSVELVAKIDDKKLLAEQHGNNIILCSILRYKKQSVWKNCNKKTSILWTYSYNTPLEVGDILHIRNITISNNISRKNNTSATYSDYLCKEGLLGIVCNQKLDYSLLERPAFSLWRMINQYKQSLYRRICNKINAPTSALFSCIFWGMPATHLNKNIRIIFNNWGLSHYLARSGLHLVIFIVGWMFILQFIPINFKLKQLFLVILCLIYTLLTGQSISFVRAFLISLISHIGKAFYQQNTLLHFICIICLLILLYNPMQLFFLDFQLTFALTFALAFLAEHQHIYRQRSKNINLI